MSVCLEQKKLRRLKKKTESSESQTVLEVGISLKNRKQFNDLEKQAREFLYALKDDLQEITSILNEIEKSGWDDKKIEALSELETKANKNVLSAFADLRKREVHDEINDLNKITNGGAVFITGKIPAGTIINIRRSRFNVPASTTDKAYSFDENGIKFDSCKELLKSYQEYFFKMPT